jgi:AraC-like DNA-binding protein
MHFVGQPLIHYLTHWRMQKAAGLLISGASNIAAIAEDVAYESEAAFSRAFKRLAGARHQRPGAGSERP